jgi:hypothetical protein
VPSTRERSIAAVRDIAARIRPGMSTAEAIALADARLRLRALGAERNWHPTDVRFGPDTTCWWGQPGDHGCELVREVAGHRISGFPHKLYATQRLGEAGFAPGDGLLVLEIPPRDRERPVDAFFEDVLLRDAAVASA